MRINKPDWGVVTDEKSSMFQTQSKLLRLANQLIDSNDEHETAIAELEGHMTIEERDAQVDEIERLKAENAELSEAIVTYKESVLQNRNVVSRVYEENAELRENCESLNKSCDAYEKELEHIRQLWIPFGCAKEMDDEITRLTTYELAKAALEGNEKLLGEIAELKAENERLKDETCGITCLEHDNVLKANVKLANENTTLKAENNELRQITATDSSGRWMLVEKYKAENDRLKKGQRETNDKLKEAYAYLEDAYADLAQAQERIKRAKEATVYLKREVAMGQRGVYIKEDIEAILAALNEDLSRVDGSY